MIHLEIIDFLGREFKKKTSIHFMVYIVGLQFTGFSSYIVFHRVLLYSV